MDVLLPFIGFALCLLAPFAYAAFQRPLWLVYPGTLAVAFLACCWAFLASDGAMDLDTGVGLVFLIWQAGAQTAVTIFAAINRPKRLLPPVIFSLCAAVLYDGTWYVSTRPLMEKSVTAFTISLVVMLTTAVVDAAAWFIGRQRRTNDAEPPPAPIP